jgi:hypothetical protein
MENIVSNLTIQYLDELDSEPLDHYKGFLRDACDQSPPAHGMDWYGMRYRELASDPIWFANSLVVNSEREGYGSQRIWLFADLIRDQYTATLVRGHSIDESQHSRMFIRLLELIFPNSVDDELRSALFELSPGYTKKRNPGIGPATVSCSDEEILDEIIQVNLVEIRSLFLQLLLRPVALAYCPPGNVVKVKRILDFLLRDEVRHIEYSARCIERVVAAGKAELVRVHMIERQAGLNDITCSEVEGEEYRFCGDCTGCSRSCALLSSLPSRRASAEARA